MWCIIKEIISAYRGGEIIMERRYNVLDLALYIINYCNEKGNSISNLQLQKIVYYVQAATYMGVGHEKVRELIEKQDTDFPYFKSGCKARIDKKLLDEWIEKVSKEHRLI